MYQGRKLKRSFFRMNVQNFLLEEDFGGCNIFGNPKLSPNVNSLERKREVAKMKGNTRCF
jgi:hypothetical protein